MVLEGRPTSSVVYLSRIMASTELGIRRQLRNQEGVSIIGLENVKMLHQASGNQIC